MMCLLTFSLALYYVMLTGCVCPLEKYKDNAESCVVMSASSPWERSSEMSESAKMSNNPYIQTLQLLLFINDRSSNQSFKLILFSSNTDCLDTECKTMTDKRFKKMLEKILKLFASITILIK